MKNPSQLNKLIRRVQSEGYTYPTEYSYISDSFARLVVPVGRKGAGTIRTMKQANDYLIKKYGSEAILFTREEYESELTLLREQLGKQTTYRGFQSKLRSGYIDIINDAMEATGTEINYREISTEQMKDAVEQASKDAKRDSRGSPSFYEYLLSYLS